MNRSWGFSLTDTAYKSVREIIHTLVRAAGSGANLLLNVGPRPDGTIPPESVERLRGVGEWMSRYGASVQDTRAGPIPPREWGVTTRRGDTVYVHVLDWPDAVLSMPPLDTRIIRARQITGQPVPFTQSAEALTLRVGEPATGEPVRVIVLETSGRR